MKIQNFITSLVKSYQLHRYPKACRKYKNEPCRFKYGKIFSIETLAAELLPENMPEEIKVLVLRKKYEILDKVRDYINNFVNPSKANFFDPTRDDFIEVKSVSEVLEDLSITKQEYENTLKIFDDNFYQLHLRWPTDLCFVNNYFDIGLLAWEANIDIQPVFDYYKAVTYMGSYLSKQEDECSQAMKQAFNESLERGVGSYEQMKSVAHAYVSKCECSLQEAVYQVMPELWLRKVFPGVLYANSNIPAKRVRMMLSKKEILELPEDSTDIHKRNVVSRYLIRPHDEMFEHLCYALFIKRYQLKTKPIENDSQPEDLIDKLIETNHSISSSYPEVLVLSSGEKLHYHKVEMVLRYHVPNKFKDPEGYAHHLLFMFYPFRDECELKVGQLSSYSSKLSEPGALEIGNSNKSLVEPYSDLVNATFLNYRADITSSWDPFSQQKNEDVENELCEIELNDQTEISCPDEENQNDENYSETVSSELHTTILSDSEIDSKIRSLNLKQRQINDFIYNWAKSHVKVKCGTTSKQSAPFHLFLSGSGGCGKSYLIKTVFHAVNKVFLYRSGDPAKPRVLLLAPTGVASISINGNTVN